jgi:hypothetical protein
MCTYVQIALNWILFDKRWNREATFFDLFSSLTNGKQMNGFLAPLPVFAASQCGQFGRNFSIGSLFTCLGEIFPSGPFLPVWAKFFHWVLFTSLGDIFPQGPFYQFGRYFSTGSFLLVWAEFLALRWNVEPRITDHRHADNTDVHTCYSYICT